MTVSVSHSLVTRVTDDGALVAPDQGQVVDTIEHTVSWPDGVAINTADKQYSKKIVLTASGTSTLDLAGALTDQFGRTVTMVKIRSITIRNLNTVAGDTVKIGPGASAGITTMFGGTTPTIDIDPGGAFFNSSPIDGWVVTATTADKLVLTEIGGVNSVTVHVIITGTSA